MADVYLLGQADDLATLTPEDSPDTVALCLQTGPLDQEARLPLYALMHGLVLDDAKSFEYLDRALSEEGPYLMGVDDRFPDLLAGLEESELEATVDHWHACAAVEALAIDKDDLTKFLFELANLCKIRDQNPELDLYLFCEGY
ncbi:MAG: hypothetical protein CBC55_08455 [Gammaproteobacteria bacterium TMED95]|jgi:hypothetical protein|nr:hypothetical protein [Gammaproteobacteria bacterium]OUV20720.1 MAG: hypothetical protein CBC55_08455 [Gammaproteobacteria bacterium TMED95]